VRPEPAACRCATRALISLPGDGWRAGFGNRAVSDEAAMDGRRPEGLGFRSHCISVQTCERPGVQSPLHVPPGRSNAFGQTHPLRIIALPAFIRLSGTRDEPPGSRGQCGFSAELLPGPRRRADAERVAHRFPSERSATVLQAEGMVSVQAECDLGNARKLLAERATVHGMTVEQVAAAVVDQRIRFGTGSA